MSHARGRRANAAGTFFGDLSPPLVEVTELADDAGLMMQFDRNRSVLQSFVWDIVVRLSVSVLYMESSGIIYYCSV